MSVYCTRRELSEATINNSYSICKDRDGNFVFHTVPGVDCNTIDTFKSQVVNNPSRMYDLFEYKRRREARRLWNAISDNLEDQPEFCSECDEGFQRVDNRCVPDFKSANAATESITLPQYESCGANGRILTQCEINKTVSTGLMTSTNCDYDGKTWHGCTECGAGYILDSKFKQCIRKGKMLECPQGSTLVPTDHQATNDSILAHNMGSFKCQHDWMNTFENFGHIYYCGSSNNPIKRAATDVVVQCIGTDTIGDADKITKGQLTWSDSKQGEECYCAPKDMQNSLFRYGWSDVWDPDDASKTYTHLELKSKSKPAVNLMYERERYGLLGGIGGPPGSERERREREQREQREREQRDREREQREREQREREQREREQREREQRERYGLLGGIGGPPGSERERREREQREQREREQRDREREQREREQRERKSNVKESNVKESNVKESNVKESNVKESNVKESNVTVKESNVKESNVKESNVNDMDCSVDRPVLRENDVKESNVNDMDCPVVDLRENDVKESNVNDMDCPVVDLRENDVKESNVNDMDVERSVDRPVDLRENDVKESNVNDMDVERSVDRPVDLRENDVKEGNVTVIESNMTVKESNVKESNVKESNVREKSPNATLDLKNLLILSEC